MNKSLEIREKNEEKGETINKREKKSKMKKDQCKN